MNTNVLDFSDYDGQSFSELNNMKFLDFESLQKNQNNSLATSIKNNSIERRTPLSYSPLSKNGNDVRDNFFGGSKIHKYNNFEIIVDPSSPINPFEKIKAIEHCFYNDTNKSGIYGDTIKGVEDKYIFTVKLFISEIKEQIKEVYNDPTIIPADDEILLFLENNQGDWSSSTMYVKKGRNITQEQFEGLSKSGDNNDKLGYVHYLNQEYNINNSELIEFLETGVIKNKLFDIISYLFEFSSLFVSNPVLLSGVGTAIQKAIDFIQEKCTIKDTNWNPTKSKDFKPFLFSDITTALDTIDDTEINNYLKSGITELQNKIEKYDKTIENSILEISKLPILTFLPLVPTVSVPNTFSELLLQKYHSLRNSIYVMLIDAENLDFSDMAKEGVYCINAFLCGVWNGFVEAVCGIISLVKYLFEGAGLLADVLKNFKTRGPEILEKIDDITTKFHALDFGKIFTSLVKSIKTWINSDHSVSLVEISYFCGAFLGFVIELAVEIVGGILISGGVLSVEAVLAKIAEAFKVFASLIFGAIKLPFTIAGKTIEGFMKALHWFYEFLAKGTNEFLRIIDEVFAKLKQVGEEFAQGLKDIFSKETKTDELFRKIEKKFNLIGEEILSVSDIKKLRKLLNEFFDVPLEIVDGNPALKERLKYWTKKGIAGSFNPINGVMYLRKEVTAYTVKHEMFHMKLWYKMTKEFPEFSEIYAKTVGNKLFHEEYVLHEFMKNPSNWKEADLLNDLSNINDLRRDLDLPKVDLEYYKKWSLEKELLKFK